MIQVPCNAMFDHPVWQTDLSGWQLIEASAGTGKTWTMAGLFVRAIVELGVPIEGILALTYTRAATDELKRRITAELQTAHWVLSGVQEPKPESFSASLVGRLTNIGAVQQAVTRLELALANLDKLAVFTLHGFGQRVARLHGTALGLAPEQTVTTDAMTWLRPALDRFWRLLCAENPLLTQALVELDLNPEVLLKSMELALSFPMATTRPPAKTAQEIVTLLHHAWQQMRAISSEDWAQLGEWICDQPWSSRHGGKRKAWLTRAPLLAQFVHGESYVANKKQIEAMARFSLDVVQATVKDEAVVLAEPRMQLCSLYCQALEGVQGLTASIAYAFRLWCAGHLSGLKRELGLQTHDDVLLALSAALTHSEIKDELARELGQRFPVAFLDESQDTDRVPLSVIEAVYGRAGQMGEPHCFIAVGDPKQSIYRFRGADVHEFLGVRARVAEPQTLDINRRSQPLLVQACNRLFARPGVFALEGLEFSPVRSIALAEGEQERARPLHWVWLEEGSKKDLRPRVLAALQFFVKRELACGTKENEIAVLVQTNRQGAWVQECLSSIGLSSVIVSQESVFVSEESRELLAVLLALADPADSGQLRAAGATRLLGLRAEQLLDGAALEELRLQCWRGRELLQASVGLSGLRAWLVSQGCYQRLASLVNAERRLSNLQQLLELLRSSRPMLKSPLAGAQWLEQAQSRERVIEGEQLLLESDQQLIRIVTQHASKGLEYPVVLLPYAWDASRFPATNWQGPFLDHEPTTALDFHAPLDTAVQQRREQEERAEKIRLFYVAVTRAQRALYLFATEPVENHHAGLSGMQLALGMQAQVGSSLPALRAMCEELPLVMQLELASEIALAQTDDTSGSTRALGSVDWTLSTNASALPQPWRFSSYSSLLRASEAHSVVDIDAQADAQIRIADTPMSGPAAIRERFVAGAQAGIALHSILEAKDFRQAFSAAQMSVCLAQCACSQEPAEEVANWLNEVLATPLGGRALNTVASRDCLSEMEFMLAARHRTDGEGGGLGAALAGLSLAAPSRDELASLSQGGLDGLLQGFIDLIFAVDGRYFVLDWKSNHLGDSELAYSQDAMRTAMIEHRYDWQAAIYLLALHRHLRSSLPGYQVERHLGGAWYVFLRGAGDPRRPSGSGVFHYAPHWQALALLDEELR
jgi:exodeoxyribonuclease V beta subunit